MEKTKRKPEDEYNKKITELMERYIDQLINDIDYVIGKLGEDDKIRLRRHFKITTATYIHHKTNYIMECE